MGVYRCCMKVECCVEVGVACAGVVLCRGGWCAEVGVVQGWVLCRGVLDES